MPMTLLCQVALLLWLLRKNWGDLRSSWTEVMDLADRERTRALASA